MSRVEEDEEQGEESPRLARTKSPPLQRRLLARSTSPSTARSPSTSFTPVLSLTSSSQSFLIPSASSPSRSSYLPSPITLDAPSPRTPSSASPSTSFPTSGPRRISEVSSPRTSFGEGGEEISGVKGILHGGKKHRRVASGSGRVHFSLQPDYLPPSPRSASSSPRCFSNSPSVSPSSSFLHLPLQRSALASHSSTSPSASPSTSPLSSPRTSPRGSYPSTPTSSSYLSAEPSSPRRPTSPRGSNSRPSHPIIPPLVIPLPLHLSQSSFSSPSAPPDTTTSTAIEEVEKGEEKSEQEDSKEEGRKDENEDKKEKEEEKTEESGEKGKEEQENENSASSSSSSAFVPLLSTASSYTTSPTSSVDVSRNSFQGDIRVKELANRAALAWGKAMGKNAARLDASSMNSSNTSFANPSSPEDTRSYDSGGRSDGLSLPLPPSTPSGQQSHQQIMEYISPYSPSSNTPLIMRRPALIRSTTAAVLFPELAAQTKTTGISEWLRLRATVLTSPTSSARRWWHLALFICVCQLSITIPFRLSFQTVWRNSWDAALFLILDLTSDFFALVDILLQLQTPYNDGGFYITDARKIRKHYFLTWFLVDFIAILPLPACLVDMTVKGYIIPRQGWARLPCLLRILHVGSWFDTWEQYTISWHEGVKLGKMGIGLLVLLHWMGCLWMGLSYYEGFGSDDWVVPSYAIHYSTNELYLMSFYWAINSVASMGSMREPANQLERVATIFVGLISLILVATIIGSIAGLISNLDMRSQLFRRKMQNINLFSNNRKLPEELTARIRNYFVNLWSRQGGIDDGAILAELPANLRTDVSLFMNKDIVQKIPMFSRSVPGFVNALVPYLKPLISSPGDTILKEGDLGHEMYFISRGAMQVIKVGSVVATLREGDSFGEIALLLEDSRRTATIQSTSYCDLFVLTKSSLEKVLRSFPDQRRIFVQMAQARQGKDQIRSSLYNYFHSSVLPNSVCDQLADAFIPFPDLLPGDVLFRYDQVARAMYFVKSGVLDIRDSEGDSLTQLHEGCFFGLIHDGKYDVSSYVMVPTVVFQLTQAAYERVLVHTEELTHRNAVRDFIKQFSMPEAYRHLRREMHTLDLNTLEESEAPWQKPLRNLASMNDEALTGRLSTMGETEILEVIECLNQISLKATRELRFRRSRTQT